jgi:Tetratricopeptide repeat
VARTRRLGDNAGIASDDSRAQVQLDQGTLARRRRDLGEDHPDTLASAGNLAVSLRAAGEYQAARELDEDSLARRRRILGEDHPDTLASASGLAISLRAVGGHPGTLTSPSSLAASIGHRGEHQAARELGEDTLARRRRVLGEDHPDTLAAAFQLVCALSELGEHHAARELNDDIIARRRRVLGDDHPETIMAGAFDLILRGLDIGGEPEWMAALREANKRRQQDAREVNEDEPG